eukprot:20182-Heterococcus_DN1.PRE.1
MHQTFFVYGQGSITTWQNETAIAYLTAAASSEATAGRSASVTLLDAALILPLLLLLLALLPHFLAAFDCLGEGVATGATGAAATGDTGAGLAGLVGAAVAGAGCVCVCHESAM